MRHPHHHSGRHGGGRHMRGPDDGPGRGGPRRRRLFDGNELRLVLLRLIEAQPRHGYDLIREIESRAGGAYAPSPGVVYPTATLLLDMGLVEEAAGEGGRKLFAITEAGRAHLADNAAQTDVAFARLDALADVNSRTEAAPVKRAMQNLKVAIHDRLSQDGVDKDVILAVAALIDQAASGVERV